MSPSNRKTEDFLASYIEYTMKQESPEVFHLWTGIGVICACLGQRTWINRSQYKIYPNAYIILVSDSGICRKSTAVSIGRDLLQGMDRQGPLMLPQRATPEVMVKLLKDNIQIDHIAKRRICGGVIVASELDSMFAGDERRKDHLLTLLTDLYDVPKTFNSATITRKEEVIPYPCLSLLGASTMEWLRGIVGERGVGGGFASRVYFVHAETTDRFIPHPTKEARLRQDLIQDLCEISEYRGPWEIAPEALKWFEAYYAQCYEYASTCEPAFRGYASRKSDHMLRISLVLSASMGVNDYLLQENVMQRAAAIVDSLETSLGAIYEDITMTRDGKTRFEIQETIRKSGKQGIQRSTLLRKFQRKVDAKRFEEVIATLEMSGLVERILQSSGGQLFRSREIIL